MYITQRYWKRCSHLYNDSYTEFQKEFNLKRDAGDFSNYEEQNRWVRDNAPRSYCGLHLSYVRDEQEIMEHDVSKQLGLCKTCLKAFLSRKRKRTETLEKTLYQIRIMIPGR